MSLSYDPDSLPSAIKTIAANTDQRRAFISECIKHAKEIQRKAAQEYDNMVSSLLICLENFDVINGNALEILCELTVLDILLGLDLTATQVSQCNSYIRLCLRAIRDTNVATAAAKTFSDSLTFNLASEFVRNQVDEVLQWIKTTSSSQLPYKVCGLLILTEVALRVPMILLAKLGDIFDSLWDSLSSENDEVRPRAVTLLNLCAKLLSSRPPSVRAETYDVLMQQLKSHVSSKSRAKKIAGLLAFEPIVINASGLSPPLRYEDLSILLVPFFLGSGATNNPEIRELLCRCLVVLCRFSTSLFVTNQLKDTVRFAVESIKKNIQRRTALELITEIVPIVGKNEFKNFAEDVCGVIMGVVKESAAPCWEALKCFSTICKYCTLTKMDVYVEIFIDCLFRWGLSAQVTECMRDITAASSARYRTRLEEALLDMISITLCGLPFRQQVNGERYAALATDDPTEAQISVALNALMNFGFSNSELMGDFLRDSVLPFIDNHSAGIRNAAIYTIVKLLIPSGEKSNLSVSRLICVNMVISRMLVVGLSDPNPVVRQTILSSFSADFYPYLSEQQHLFRLYSALGDESVNCRVAAVEQLCHMINYDPSHILPALREEMVLVLHYIESSFNMDLVETGLRVLTAIASKAPQFVVNFSEGIFRCLVPNFAALAIRSPILLPFLHCCTAFAKAAQQFGNIESVFVNEIPAVCELFDSFPFEPAYHAARLSCLRFFSATLRPLINGEPPYKMYPRLFPQLSHVLRNGEENMDIRLEALRCVGVIGALDAHRFHAFSLQVPATDTAATTTQFVDLMTHGKCCRVVLHAIAEMLEPTTNQRGLARDVLRTVIQTVSIISDRCPPARDNIGVVIPPLARVITELPDGRLLASSLYEFCVILKHCSSASLKEASPDLYAVFENVWASHKMYRFLVVHMLSIVATASHSENVQYGQRHSNILPRLFDALSRSDSSPDLQYAILDYIVRHIDTLQPYCGAVVQNLLAVVQDARNPEEFVHACVTALKVVCTRLYVDELVGAVVRGLLVCLCNDLARHNGVRASTGAAGNKGLSLFDNIMGVFSTLIVELQADFLKHAAYITQTLKTYRITHNEFSILSSQIASGAKCSRSSSAIKAYKSEVDGLIRRCDNVITRRISILGEIWNYMQVSDEPTAAVGSSAAYSNARGGAGAADEKIMPRNEQRVLNCMKTVPVAREEWVKWGDQFILSIFQESPYQVFRCVSLPGGVNFAPLVEKSKQLVKDIQEVAFRAIWMYGSAVFRTTTLEFFRQTLREGINSENVPDDVLLMVLNIVEYMDLVGKTLSVSFGDLSDCAWRRGMLAKALYWREKAYRNDPVATVESLISLYSELHMVDSSVGILNLASEEQRRALLQSSLVKLARYSEALELTQQELVQNDADTSENSSEIVPRYGYKGNNFRGWNRMYSYGASSSDKGNSFSRSEEAILRDRQLESHARLMLCLSELGDYSKVLDEWAKLRKATVKNSSSGSSGGVGGGAAVPGKSGSLRNAEAEEGNVLHYVSQYAAEAAIRVQSWQTLEEVLPWMPKGDVLHCIASATLCTTKQKYDEAIAFVNDGRRVLLDDLSGLLQDSYVRAYEGLVIAQELTEVEEIVLAKRTEMLLGSVEHIPIIAKLWEQRIRVMAPNVTSWKQVLGVRSLLIPPASDVKTYTRFVKLCRQENAKVLEKFTLDQLLGHSNPTYAQLTSRSANPRVIMQYISYLSTSGQLGASSAFGTESALIKTVIDVHSKTENAVILSRAYARLGFLSDEVNESIECFKAATLYDPKWNLGWRLWAETNTELLSREFSEARCANAIEGYINSIRLDTSHATLIQDVLKLLTLWSKHADCASGLKVLSKRVADVPSQVWHLVVPQLIARLDSGSDDSCSLVSVILTTVSYDYPHTLIYPLNLCRMSDSARRHQWADEIIAKMQVRFPVLVLQGKIVIDELIRTSALLHEQWYDKLEAAAAAYFGRHDREEMIGIILPMHETLTRAAETVMEMEFVAKYSKLLGAAKDWVRAYTSTKNVGDLQSAWNIYHSVYRQIDAQVKASNSLRMQFCSPRLFEARDLTIGFPNAQPLQEESVSKIASFSEEVIVISSKQRPKRIAVRTAEGKVQKYLLKGREDLRLDERVMQLFDLVNVLMSSDSRSCKNFGYQIQRYSVTPLKDTVGIIGWVDGCDTLHEMVRGYRCGKGIVAELEMRMLNQIITVDNGKAYDFLTIMSKVEVMEFLADHTSGHDIRKAMWALSINCERWLEQRRMFTTSLANMSVVGYILGLGDRHPNNIMIQKTSGLIVHIDFGDCFEVAMTRDKFPEKIPFRLTRMLRNALDVSGVEGAYRSSAETTMSVLRESSHSVLALMEAFIQDPLISWRLVNQPGQEPESSNEHKTMEEQITTAAKLKDDATGRVGGGVGGASAQAGIGGGASMEGHNSVGKEVLMHLFGEEVDAVHQGVLIFGRLRSKLKGLDFITVDNLDDMESADPQTQVGTLIAEAIDITNVAQSWSGWYPFW